MKGNISSTEKKNLAVPLEQRYPYILGTEIIVELFDTIIEKDSSGLEIKEGIRKLRLVKLWCIWAESAEAKEPA